MRWQQAVAAELADETGVPAADLRVLVVASALGGAFRAGLLAWQCNNGATPLRHEVARANAILADLPHWVTN